VHEPTVRATIVAPSAYAGPIMQLASGRRGEQLEYSFLGGGASGSASTSSGGSSSDSGSGGTSSSGGSGSGSGSGPNAVGDRVVLKYSVGTRQLLLVAAAGMRAGASCGVCSTCEGHDRARLSQQPAVHLPCSCPSPSWPATSTAS